MLPQPQGELETLAPRLGRAIPALSRGGSATSLRAMLRMTDVQTLWNRLHPISHPMWENGMSILELGSTPRPKARLSPDWEWSKKCTRSLIEYWRSKREKTSSPTQRTIKCRSWNNFKVTHQTSYVQLKSLTYQNQFCISDILPANQNFYIAHVSTLTRSEHRHSQSKKKKRQRHRKRQRH